jgi:hypothetical protein
LKEGHDIWLSENAAGPLFTESFPSPVDVALAHMLGQRFGVHRQKLGQA